jgi:hypothetical protein
MCGRPRCLCALPSWPRVVAPGARSVATGQPALALSTPPHDQGGHQQQGHGRETAEGRPGPPAAAPSRCGVLGRRPECVAGSSTHQSCGGGGAIARGQWPTHHLVVGRWSAMRPALALVALLLECRTRREGIVCKPIDLAGRALDLRSREAVHGALLDVWRKPGSRGLRRDVAEGKGDEYGDQLGLEASSEPRATPESRWRDVRVSGRSAWGLGSQSGEWRAVASCEYTPVPADERYTECGVSPQL